MRQQYEIETRRAAAAPWSGEISEPGDEAERIDLDRVVWDPEYRNQVLEQFRGGG